MTPGPRGTVSAKCAAHAGQAGQELKPGAGREEEQFGGHQHHSLAPQPSKRRRPLTIKQMLAKLTSSSVGQKNNGRRWFVLSLFDFT